MKIFTHSWWAPPIAEWLERASCVVRSWNTTERREKPRRLENVEWKRKPRRHRHDRCAAREAFGVRGAWTDRRAIARLSAPIDETFQVAHWENNSSEQTGPIFEISEARKKWKFESRSILVFVRENFASFQLRSEQASPNVPSPRANLLCCRAIRNYGRWLGLILGGHDLSSAPKAGPSLALQKKYFLSAHSFSFNARRETLTAEVESDVIGIIFVGQWRAIWRDFSRSLMECFTDPIAGGLMVTCLGINLMMKVIRFWLEKIATIICGEKNDSLWWPNRRKARSEVFVFSSCKQNKQSEAFTRIIIVTAKRF